MKNNVAHLFAGIGSFLALVALAPAELQNQVPQLFPENYRGFIALGLGLVSFLARSYAAQKR